MRSHRATIIAVLLAAAAVAVAIAFGGKKDASAKVKEPAVPGQPRVEIVSPRNGARQNSHAVVVKAKVENFQLAPGQFGRDPQLGEGHLRFSLNRVPNCVDPVKLLHALNSPLGKNRLVGASFDYPQYAGPNGVLADRLGTAGSYSPATKPEIFYHHLPPGLYRLVITLAQNNGSTTPTHDVTNFQILQRPGHHTKKCEKGKVPAQAAAASFE